MTAGPAPLYNGFTMGNTRSVSGPLLAFARLEGAWVTAAGLADRPAVVASGAVVADVSPAARAAGLRPGIRVRSARRLVSDLMVVEREAIDPLAALEPLYEVLLGLSPQVEPVVDHLAAYCALSPASAGDEVIAALQAGKLERWGHRLIVGIGHGRLVARMAARVAARTRAGGSGAGARAPQVVAEVQGGNAARSGDPGSGGGAGVSAARALEVVSCRVPPGQEAPFLAPMPVTTLQEEVPPAARRQLQRLGLYTLGDVAMAPRQVVARAVGEQAPLLQAWCRGDDRRPLAPGYPPPGVTATLEAPPELGDDLRAPWWPAQLPRLAQQVAGRLVATGCAGRLVILEGERSRVGRYLPVATTAPDGLARAALELYRRLLADEPAPGRLALTVTALEPVARQLALDGLVPDARPAGNPGPGPAGPPRCREPEAPALLDELARRYPGRVFWGRERPVPRRERQLAYWDPWRGAPRGPAP